MKLDSSQQQAIDRIEEVIRMGGPNSVTIGGLAGSGKTTVIGEVLKNPMLGRIAVVAFTGKAASVLNKKGIPGATTMHSLMYKFDPRRREFYKRFRIDYDAIIVDEASMVNSKLYDDIMSYRIPVIFVGDHGQLEPIGNNPNIMKNPDIVLDTIHRQEEGSGIITAAHELRNSEPVSWNPDVSFVGYEDACDDLNNFDVVLCGYNSTRRKLNKLARTQRGFVDLMNEGDKIVCLKNNHTQGIFNGMILVVKTVHRFSETGMWLTLVDPETDTTYKNMRCRLFDDAKEDEYKKLSDSILAIDYGYALTVHKSQGSEWPNILVAQEPNAPWDTARWEYTAATRAATHLTWTYVE